MKLLPNVLPLLVTTMTLATGSFASDLSDLLTEAQRSYIRGDLADAKKKFEMIRNADPNNRTAYSYLRRITADEAAQKASKTPPNPTQDALTKLVLEKVDFREASLSEVLDYLRQKAAQSSGKVAVNFVQHLDEATRNAKVTLTLQRVPFTEVLRYIGDLVGVQFSYEPYAIVVKPKGAAPAPVANTAPPPQ